MLLLLLLLSEGDEGGNDICCGDVMDAVGDTWSTKLGFVEKKRNWLRLIIIIIIIIVIVMYCHSVVCV